ncbi:MAG: hypothetical protein J3K34DRAFT_480065 [Monoraphidium minutum]|nr:MAG: hypothetical protein J3K34DRAFT_480065 [Monoraphidium minutum]
MAHHRAALIAVLIVLAGIAGARAQAFKAPSAVSAVEAVPYLSTLLAAVKAANLTDALGPSFNGTLIAPQDSGFANLTSILGLSAPTDLLSRNNSGLLLQVLQYHVIPGVALLPQRLQTGQRLPTLVGGAQIAVDRRVPGLTHLVGGTPYNVATLLGYQAVRGDSAVVYVTDQVLLPADVINSNPELTAVFQRLGR